MKTDSGSTAGKSLLTTYSKATDPAAHTRAFLDALAGVAEVAVGEYTGTGAALDVALPFDPVFVLVNNLTDGDTFGFAVKTANVGTKSQSVVLATAQEASQGILFAAAGTKKFSLGTSAVLNETGKVFQYIAIGV